MARSRSLRPWIAGLVCVALAAVLTTAAAKPHHRHHYPWAKRVAAAKRWADGRAGRISFAVVDETGKLHGSHPDRVHNSASVAKVMFMVALLRQPDVRHDALSAGERHLLGPMIKRSDNAAATAVFNRVGEAALYRLARDAGLDHFSTQPTWGLTTITAGSQARFMYRLQRFIPKRHRTYAMHLLSQNRRLAAVGNPSGGTPRMAVALQGRLVGGAELAGQPGDAPAAAAASLLDRGPHARAALVWLRPALHRGRRAAAARALQPRQPLKQLPEDARRRPPDQVLADDVRRRPDRDPAAHQAAHRKALA